MSWLGKIFSKTRSVQHETNSNSGKDFHEIFNELGVFKYDDDGFTITYEDFIRRVNWADITQINVYKVDQFTVDRIDMQIVCGDKAFSISEELPGWYQFVLKTKEVYPSIPKDWDFKIIQPAFATNFTTIYDKSLNTPNSQTS